MQALMLSWSMIMLVNYSFINVNYSVLTYIVHLVLIPVMLSNIGVKLYKVADEVHSKRVVNSDVVSEIKVVTITNLDCIE